MEAFSWEGDAPKQIIDADKFNELKRFLKTKQIVDFNSDTDYFPMIDLSDTLIHALHLSYSDQSLDLGLDVIKQKINREEKGLLKNIAEGKSTKPRRISKILLISSDGSERFYRDVKNLISQTQPRIAVIQLNCSSSDLSQAISGNTGNIKAAITNHKNAFNLIITALFKLSDQFETND